MIIRWDGQHKFMFYFVSFVNRISALTCLHSLLRVVSANNSGEMFDLGQNPWVHPDLLMAKKFS